MDEKWQMRFMRIYVVHAEISDDINNIKNVIL